MGRNLCGTKSVKISMWDEICLGRNLSLPTGTVSKEHFECRMFETETFTSIIGIFVQGRTMFLLQREWTYERS